VPCTTAVKNGSMASHGTNESWSYGRLPRCRVERAAPAAGVDPGHPGAGRVAACPCKIVTGNTVWRNRVMGLYVNSASPADRTYLAVFAGR
jgi:hypothetical protein